jgi:putative MATE family efflux protein
MIGTAMVNPMLRLMDAPDDVFASSRQYLTIYFSGITGLLLYNMGAGILRAVGDSRRPLYILIFSALINIAGDLLFVVVGGMGVAGVAYATLISQCLSALVVLYLLSKDRGAFGIRWNKLCLDKETIRSIISIGLPSGIQQAVTSFSNVFVQGYINQFGSACMAGWSGYNKVDSFAMIPVQAIAMGSTTFVGQNFGARKLDRARKGVKTALSLSISITVVLSILMMLLARPLLNLFTTDPEVVDFGQKFILLISPFCFTICFNQIFAGALRGTGDAKAPMLILLFSFVLFRQAYLFVSKLLGNAFVMIGLAYPMGWVMCSFLLYLWYRKSILGKKGTAAAE